MSDAGEETTSQGVPNAPARVPDEQLLQSHELARAALLEITPAATVGDVAGYLVEDEHVLSLRFENRMLGYPGWFWTVTIARVEGSEPTVLEAELMPGDGALLAPEWVPWAVRLAEYQAAQAAAAAERAAAGESDEDDDEADDSDELDDLDDEDEDDFETDGSANLHSGDLDGVDIDPDDDDEDDDDEDADDEDDDDEDADDDSDEDEDEGDFIDDSDDPEGTDRSY